MILDSSKKLNKERIDRFYEPDHSGIIIIHDEILGKKIIQEFKKIVHEKFTLKDHQDINNGQYYYSGDNKVFLKIYNDLRKRFPSTEAETILDCSFTKYPVSNQGAEYHQDFSKNMICTVTFFSGYTECLVADTKQGKNRIVLPIRPGDILIMRAPRNNSESEKLLRPIHAIGTVPDVLYSYEIRQTKNHP